MEPQCCNKNVNLSLDYAKKVCMQNDPTVNLKKEERSQILGFTYNVTDIDAGNWELGTWNVAADEACNSKRAERSVVAASGIVPVSAIVRVFPYIVHKPALQREPTCNYPYLSIITSRRTENRHGHKTGCMFWMSLKNDQRVHGNSLHRHFTLLYWQRCVSLSRSLRSQQ